MHRDTGHQTPAPLLPAVKERGEYPRPSQSFTCIRNEAGFPVELENCPQFFVLLDTPSSVRPSFRDLLFVGRRLVDTA